MKNWIFFTNYLFHIKKLLYLCTMEKYILNIECEHPVIIYNRRLSELIGLGYKHFIDVNISTNLIPVSRLYATYSPLISHYENVFTGRIGYRCDFVENRDEWFRVYSLSYDKIKNIYLINQTTGETEPVFVLVPCNHCETCRKKKVESYRRRLLLESCNYSEEPFFITLTIDPAHYPTNPYSRPVITDMIQRFHKRLRRYLSYRGYSTNYKYFFVSEYGSRFGRLHFHGVIYGIHRDLYDPIPNIWSDKDKFNYISKFSHIIRNVWKLGFSRTDYCIDSTGAYAMKYIGKSSKKKTYNWHSNNLSLDIINLHKDEIQKNSHLQDFPIMIRKLSRSTGQYILTPYYFPIDRYFINKCYPSYKVSLSVEFRRMLISCYYDIKKLDEMKIDNKEYTALRAHFLDYYDIPIDLLKLKEMDMKYFYLLPFVSQEFRFNKVLEHFIETYDELSKHKDNDLSFDYVSYCDDLHEKHLAFSNLKEYDLNIMRKKSREYFAKLYNKENDLQ